MASVNKVIILGNLGRDPETRYSSDNSLQITTLNVATTSYRRSQSGERVQETEWHRITLFGRQAEIAQQYLRKGSSVYVEGRLRTRRWEKDGQTHYTTEIMGDTLQLVGSRNAAGDSGFGQTAASGNQGGYGASSGNDDFETPVSSPMRSNPSSGARAAQPGSSSAASSAMNDFDDDIPF